MKTYILNIHIASGECIGLRVTHDQVEKALGQLRQWKPIEVTEIDERGDENVCGAEAPYSAFVPAGVVCALSWKEEDE